MHELNVSLQKQTRELAASNAELEQFAYVSSHDLQEPLRMVTSFMALLEKKLGDTLDGKSSQYIRFAVDGAQRMRQINLDLLDFSRVGRTENSSEEVNLILLVAGILTFYQRQTDELQERIVFEILPTFHTYKAPVRQVFQNLISNAIKYQKAGKATHIQIACIETKTHFQFAVTDNGIGIPEEYFDKIFIIFKGCTIKMTTQVREWVWP